jgi:hypothetical protein
MPQNRTCNASEDATRLIISGSWPIENPAYVR